MKLQLVTCILLLTIASLKAAPRVPGEPGAPIETKKGNPTVEGGFTLPKKTYFIGEAIEVTFRITNRGPGVLEFPVGGDYRGTGRHDRFSFEAVEEEGGLVGDPVGPRGIGGGLGGAASVKPGEDYSETMPINHWCELVSPGTYTITCRRVLNVLPPGSAEAYVEERMAPKIPIETVLKVKIVEDPAALAAYIERVVAALPAGDAESEQARERLTVLALLKIPTAFPAFVKLLEHPIFQRPAIQWLADFGEEKAAAVLVEHAPKLSTGGRIEALSVLGRWKAPGTEAVVAAALRDADATLRRTAVDACSRAKYESCQPILLGMGRDPDPIVRRYLGHALGQSGEPKAIPVLLELLKDPDPDPFIKIWAAGGLGALKRTDGVRVLIELLREPKAQSAQGNVLAVLDTLTGEKFGSDRKRCLGWWEKEGRAKYGEP